MFIFPSRYYSKELFPPADNYVQYLNNYAKDLSLNIKYNTDISNIQRVEDSNDGNEPQLFSMNDQSGSTFLCRWGQFFSLYN